MTGPRRAVVLLSGGLDSATVLAHTLAEGLDVTALSFDYGQRHRFELEAARRVAAAHEVEDHRLVRLDLRAIGGSALTDDIAVPKHDGVEAIDEAIPMTYVPARNTVFLAYALGLAEVLEAREIFIGVNAVDYSGYPDCRPEFIEAFSRVANLATRIGVERGEPIRVQAPLIEMTKAQIIGRGLELGVDYALTHSCYDPTPETGRPCGRCDSCLLRAQGFREAGIEDPLLGRNP